MSSILDYLSLAALALAITCLWRTWRYALAIQRMLADLDDAAKDARLAGSIACQKARHLLEVEANLKQEANTLRHLIAEVRTVLMYAPQPLAIADFDADDTIGAGPFPISDSSPPLGGDGASSHDHGEEGEPWQNPY